MVDREHNRIKNSSITFSVSTVALAILFVLMVIATAQAQTFKVIYNFIGAPSGWGPYAGVTLDAAGNIYGAAANTNGVSGGGTIFELTPKSSGWVYNVLHRFAGGSDGSAPYGGVVFGPDGTLYGTTVIGGVRGNGTVFNVRPPATICTAVLCPWTETVLYNFTGGDDGGQPLLGGLIFDQAGNIYGATSTGGSSGGVVYQLAPSGSGWTESVLHTFGDLPNDGWAASGGVIFDNAGNLYGTTIYGGSSGNGTVFQLTHSGSGWTENILYNFQAGNDGAIPYAGLTFDHSGNLYGATTYSGSGGGGTVFELMPSNGSWTLKTLYSFAGSLSQPCGPYGTLVMDGAGNLYGTTYCDGADNAGSVFKLTPSGSGWTYTSLHDFTGGDDGGKPYSSVVFDADGNLYGTTRSGSTGCRYDSCGVVWEITP